jgi:hypothetical protein
MSVKTRPIVDRTITGTPFAKKSGELPGAKSSVAQEDSATKLVG